MDGFAVIKKKLDGRYATLGKVRLYGREPYDRVHRPFFLPGDRWLKIGTRITNTASGNVVIRLLFDDGDGTGWREVLEAVDGPGGTDGPPITSAGYTGVRTDFMDVQFTSYWAGDD